MPHEDKKYINGLLKEEVSIIKEIYKKWGPECKRFVLSNSGNVQDADDLFQECLLTILKHAKLHKIELNVPFGGYLYFIYRNKWIDTLRKRKNEQLRISESTRYTNELTSKALAEETELVNERMLLFYACLYQLSDFCKTLIDGRLKKMSSKQLMNLLKLPTANAVDFRMHKCRKQLKKLIEQHPNFEELFFRSKPKEK